MDRFLSPAMPSKQPRARSERKQQEAKMATAAGPRAATEGDDPDRADLDEQGSTGGESGTPSLAETRSASQSTHPVPPHTLEQPVTYSEVIKAVQTAMAPLFAAHTATLQQAVSELKGQLSHLTQAVNTNESRLGEVFQDVSDLKKQYETLQKSHLHLSNKVDDLENRSRRCNLRVLGIPESVKGQDLFLFLQKTLPELLNIQDACINLVIERAHRLGSARTTADGRPRVVIFKSLSFVHKEAIWVASRKQRDIRWNGGRILIFQDYSSEVSRARKEFSPLCSQLAKEGRKFALMFPARLRLHHGSSFKDFSSVADAEGFLAELRDEENGASTSDV